MHAEPFLALDTSTLVASVAVVVRDAGGLRVAASRESDVKNHSDQLITMIDDAVGEAGIRVGDLAGVAVGAGPGSFTGLRIGMATGKGLCFATGAPLYAISSLAALARDAHVQTGASVAVPILDARRGEVFFAAYDVRAPSPRLLFPEAVATPDSAAETIAAAIERPIERAAALVGDGAALCAHTLGPAFAIDSALRKTPSAASVGALAAHGTPVSSLAAAVPVYLRPSEAERRYPDGNPGGAFARRTRPST